MVFDHVNNSLTRKIRQKIHVPASGSRKEADMENTSHPQSSVGRTITVICESL